MTTDFQAMPATPQTDLERAARLKLSDALAELRQIDDDIDYSFQESMRIIAYDHGRGNDSGIFSQEARARNRLRNRKYEILAKLFGEK